MKIRGFQSYLEQFEAKKHILKNCTVIVDATSYFFRQYEKSGLQYMYGCESDKYVQYLKRNLEMFKKANIKVYFFFKSSNSKNVLKYNEKVHFVPGNETNKVVEPVFVKDIQKQVLDLMDIDYTVCEYEPMDEIIAFSRQTNCPVLSYDIVDYCLSGVSFIPIDKLSFEHHTNVINCRLIRLTNLLEKYKLTYEKISIFIALTNEDIYGNNKLLSMQRYNFFRSLNVPKSSVYRSNYLLKWLGELSKQHALDSIFQYISQNTFLSYLEDADAYINRSLVTGIPSKYLENKNDFQITEHDPWFIKGIASGWIAPPFVQLYHNPIYFDQGKIEDESVKSSVELSIDIIKYAYNLLTNFEKREIIFIDRNNTRTTISLTEEKENIPRPVFEAKHSPFQNGFDKKLKLFEFFLEKNVLLKNVADLRDSPEDVTLLLVTLVYFSKKKSIDTTNIVCSVLLSYLMLGVVFGKLPENNNAKDQKVDPKKSSVSVTDCVIANNVLKKYFALTSSQCTEIFDYTLVHPFIEFQHLLAHMNMLNRLCGAPLPPTKYWQTFNGTFAYKFIYESELNKPLGGPTLVKNLLITAPTVLAFFNNLYDVYQKVLHG